jgi:hypothetical protein
MVGAREPEGRIKTRLTVSVILAHTTAGFLSPLRDGAAERRRRRSGRHPKGQNRNQ